MSASLVEGLIVAAVAAAGGASREEVAAEARDALMGKSGHLSTPDASAAPEAGAVSADEVVGVFSVENPHGLHARPAARLVSEVRALDASVQLRNLTTGGSPVPAGSLSRFATLAALRGHEVEVRASGPQAQEAVEHLLTLAARRFDETVQAAADPPARTSTGIGAVSAWAGCLADVEREWASLPDPYLRERAADVHAVGDQVLRALTGEPARRMTSQGVLVASDLTPAETAGLDLGLVTGVVLALGSPTSHAAILARARDIPVVVGAGPEGLSIREGTTILLDGGSGELQFDPSPELLEEYQRRGADEAERRVRQLALAEQPAVSRDGRHVAVAANLGSVADARAGTGGRRRLRRARAHRVPVPRPECRARCR